MPTVEERLQWDLMAAKGELKDKKYRPWLDPKQDILAPTHETIHDAAWKAKRRRFNAAWGQPDDTT